jgi:hypothetical protein
VSLFDAASSSCCCLVILAMEGLDQYLGIHRGTLLVES